MPTTSTAYYNDLSRRRLVDLAVQRAALLQAAADALDYQAGDPAGIARMIRKHLAQVEAAAAIRRGVRAEDV